jgi:hypothetical protein
MLIFFPGTSVTTVRATDSDGSAPNNEVFYLIESGGGDNFRIDSSTGLISTTNRLDRETTPAYNLTVLAVDRSGLQILDIVLSVREERMYSHIRMDSRIYVLN